MNNMENLRVFEYRDYALIIVSIIAIIIGRLLLSDLPILAGAFLGFSFSTIPFVIYSAYERKGHKKRQSELKKEIGTLQKLIDEQMIPIYMSAIHLGETFAAKGKDPVVLKALDISNNVFDKAKQSNDYQPILDILNAKYGEKVRESFLLGYQLFIVAPQPLDRIDDEIAKQLKYRLGLLINILVDEDIINSTNRMIDRIVKRNPEDIEAKLNKFFVVLIEYLTIPEYRNQEIRRFLLDAPSQKHLVFPDENKREERVKVFMKLLEVIRLHVQDDPDVNWSYFALKGDSEGVQKAIDSGANQQIRFMDIIRKYKILLEKECPDDLERFLRLMERI